MGKLKYILRLNNYLLTILLFSFSFFISASLVSATSSQLKTFDFQPPVIEFPSNPSVFTTTSPYYTIEKETHYIQEGDDTFTQEIISFYNQQGKLVEQHIIDTEEYVFYFENGMETTTIQTAYQDNRMVFYEQKNVRDIEYTQDGKTHSLLEKEYFDIWERPLKKVSRKSIDSGDMIYIVENIYSGEQLQELKYTRVYPREKGEERSENHVIFDENGSINIRIEREFIQKPQDESTWLQEEKIYTYTGGDELVRKEYHTQTTSYQNNVFTRKKEERVWDKEEEQEFIYEVQERNERFRKDGVLHIIRTRKTIDSMLEKPVISREEYAITEAQEEDRFLESMVMKHYENDKLVEFTEKNTYRYVDYQIDKIVEYSYFDEEGQYHGGERILYYPDKKVNLLFDPEHSIVERTITYTYLPQ